MDFSNDIHLFLLCVFYPPIISSKSSSNTSKPIVIGLHCGLDVVRLVCVLIKNTINKLNTPTSGTFTVMDQCDVINIKQHNIL